MYTSGVAVSCYQVPSQPFLFQAEESQIPQPFLIWLAVQISDHMGSPSLDSLKLYHVLVKVRSPEQDAVLQLRSHQC